MIETGRVCIKIAGRDAGKKCVVTGIIDDSFVLIDGETRRKKVNVKHIEPTSTKIDIKKNASHEEVVEEFKKIGIKIKEKKPKQAKERPKKQRKQKAKEEGTENKEKAKKEKKEEKKEKKAKAKK